MFQRILKVSHSSSFFLFGARGTGKSTYLKKQFKARNPLFIDLLNPSLEHLYARHPNRLAEEISLLKKKPDWVIIDEIQKVPKLLEVVHSLIENNKMKFVLTGSSARKLKRGAANLLAGRAFLNDLYPLTFRELGVKFNLAEALHWGTMPKIFDFTKAFDKKLFLESYVLTYLQEEIRSELIIRKIDPFRNFLEIAGVSSGKIINHKKIADDVGVDFKTIQSYFQILEDTLLGFYLPAFHLSVRKSQRHAPKFYIFDLGVKKALEGSLDQTPVPRTSVYGELFESFIILEIFRLNKYLKKGFKLSFYTTKNGGEVDLILSKGNNHKLIEIKSASSIDESELRKVSEIGSAFPGKVECFYLSQSPVLAKIQGVKCFHWQKGIEEIFDI